MALFALCLLGSGVLAQTAPRPPAAAPAESRLIAVIRAVDKVTGRAATLEIPTGETAEFRTLRILVRACVRRPPEEPPETSAFLEITERRESQDRRLFSGWMYATAPSVVTLDHPLYDVWVSDCRAAPPPSR